MMPHIPENDIQQYVDTTLNKRALRAVEDHLLRCSFCSERMQALSSVHQTMKIIPREHVSPQFTLNIMQKLGIKELPSLAWSVLSNLAPFILTSIVVAVVVTVLNVAGVWNQPEFSNSIDATKSAMSVVSTEVARFSTTLNQIMVKFFPLNVTKDGITLILFLFFFLSAIALIDKYFFANLLKKRH